MTQYTDLSIDGTSKNINSRDGFVEVGAAGMKTTDIKDSAVVNETALNKMATSIPTPFARLYLYDTAFSELNALEDDEQNKGKIYKATGSDATLYHHLVAECLDLLEFIFEYGVDERFSIHEWRVVQDTNALGASTTNSADRIIDEDEEEKKEKLKEVSDKHKKLGTALRDAIINTSLKSAESIFIFKWDGEIIGGTSPFTLVYVSPNWRRKIASKRWGSFVGGSGNELFAPIKPTTKVFSLRERSEDFRLFIYALLDKHYSDFSLSSDKGGKLLNMYHYIQNTLDHYEKTRDGISPAYDKYQKTVQPRVERFFTDNYEELKGTIAESGITGRASNKVVAESIPFYTKKFKTDTESAYTIKPTVTDLPVETTRNGIKKRMEESLPLVLSSAALGSKARYWFRTPYNPMTLPARPDGDYFERNLPGVPGNPAYPYLMENDIFEDSIMNVGYIVDNHRFFTGFEGSSQFLLPLKPTFFKYFRVEDLPQMVKVTPEGFPVCKKVTVTVGIPVKGGVVNFSRVYEPGKGHQFIDFSKEGAFKLGVFPFYTYAGTPAADEDLYKVLLARQCEMSLEFYNQDFVTPLGSDVVRSKIRTEDGPNVTEHYTIGTSMKEENGGKSGTFTAIRVVKNGIGGMIVPLFKKAKVSQDKYVFCADFGTANTHVAYALAKPDTLSGNELRITENEIKTLAYSADGYHMAMLNEDGSEGAASKLNPMIDQEFAPAAIGTAKLKFPIRTIACGRRHPGQGELELFGDVNIAFNNDKYGETKDLYSYPTELKWSNDNNIKKHSALFFQELVWICKNKVAELGGNPEFEFYFTYPQTMRQKQSLIKAWETAAEQVRTNAHVFGRDVKAANGKQLHLYEGIAPWYRAISKTDSDVYYTDQFLNIDIGGGSTDIIYVQKQVKDAPREMIGKSFSAKFAANDLWGDGVSGKNKTNGYIKVFEKKIKSSLADKQQEKNYDHYAAQASHSQDLIGFIFSNCNAEFVEYLLENDKMRLPMLMHFAATIYYVGKTLSLAQLPMPKHVYFSGMGSLYVKYLSEDTDVLSDIIHAIFKYCGVKVTDKEGRRKELSVGFTENPKKVTAEGGLLMYNATKNGLTDKVVKSEELNYRLYDGEEDEEETVITFENIDDDYKSRVIDEVKRFIKLFSDREFRRACANLEGDTPTLEVVSDIDEWIEQGFDLAKNHEYPNAKNDQEINDVLFFWPIKHVLYMLGRAMADKDLTAKTEED